MGYRAARGVWAAQGGAAAADSFRGSCRTVGMTTRNDRTRLWAPPALLAAVVAVAAGLALAPQAARAQTYTDVSDKHWCRGKIDWVTNQGPAGSKLLDDHGQQFRPDREITRGQLASALVIASGHHGDTIDPVDIADVPPSHPRYHDIQVALKLKLMSGFEDGFHPGVEAKAWQVDRAVMRMLRRMNPADDFSMLTALAPGSWRPVSGWKTGAPRYFPSQVAVRYLGLHYNHPYGQEGQEVSPRQTIDRDEVAYVFYTALHLSAWQIDSLTKFKSVTFPRMTARQKTIVSYAFKYIGYPYVYAGEYPTKDSPYGAQAHGGFDCSGFVWYVLKMHFGYRINERVAADMAATARPRITRAKLVPGDMIFWGPNGPQSKASSIYHAGMYLGRGWFIHSTGSADGVSLASLNWDGWSWKSDFAWGRRVLKAGQFYAPTTADLGEPVPADVVPPMFASDGSVVSPPPFGSVGDMPATPSAP